MEREIAAAAERLGVEPAALHAVVMVESAGRAFERDGETPLGRFEPHHVPAWLRARIGLPEEWTWRDSLRMSARQRRDAYAAALAIAPELTHRATSYGIPQMMGFNHALVGYDSASAMFDAFRDVGAQIEAMARFIERRGARAALSGRDWVAFAVAYNGTGQPAVYAAKLEQEYRRLSGHSSPVVLRIGSRGEDVRRAQLRLARHGRLMASEADGAFGPQTEAAVRAFQDSMGLAVDGVIGARTWAALGGEPSAQPVPATRTAEAAEKPADITAAGVIMLAVGAREDLIDVAVSIGLQPWHVALAVLAVAAAVVVAPRMVGRVLA